MQLPLIIAAALCLTTKVAADISAGVPTLIQSEWASPRFAPCIQAQGNWDGAPVVTASCNNFHTHNETWVVVNGASTSLANKGPPTQIRLFGDKCLDVTNGQDSDGVRLQIWTCYDGNPNQLWQVNYDQTINWAGYNKCVDITNNDVRDPVVPTQIWTCGAPGTSLSQAWGYNPPH